MTRCLSTARTYERTVQRHHTTRTRPGANDNGSLRAELAETLGTGSAVWL